MATTGAFRDQTTVVNRGLPASRPHTVEVSP